MVAGLFHVCAIRQPVKENEMIAIALGILGYAAFATLHLAGLF